ncbi:IS110 family transposase [Ideonella azotifigens]|uniref:IS110-like element ISGsu4 family transposase n=1 Tax=Ideonella azotifigens TaxID=513160 RepID=A0ABP3V7U8_9BURK|nr:IS110 family transposase [Ideonella azotifigens]MCD2344968.1 IS110 family transposase [Ideonella azotifigens]
MELYAGIDLHSNNSVVSVLDEQDRVGFAKRLPNELAAIIVALRSCPSTPVGVEVESTYNWYWLVDGLQDAGFVVHLVNTAAVKQYEGLKHSGDFSDARHLAHLMRLGILPTGYIYPREQRAVRDLLRKRSQLVRQRSTQILSMGNLVARNLGTHAGGNEIKRWTSEHIDAMPLLDEQKQALKANLAVMRCLDDQVDALERSILAKAKLREDYQALKTVSGIGQVLALTIALETGDVGRFDSPGNFASYARTVDSRRESNGKKKGEGNAKCGNKHLAWAFIEAAHFAVRYDAAIKRWYQKKCSSSLSVVAIKAVAHKLARACYHVMKDGKPFDVSRAFG